MIQRVYIRVTKIFMAENKVLLANWVPLPFIDGNCSSKVVWASYSSSGLSSVTLRAARKRGNARNSIVKRVCLHNSKRRAEEHSVFRLSVSSGILPACRVAVTVYSIPAQTILQGDAVKLRRGAVFACEGAAEPRFEHCCPTPAPRAGGRSLAAAGDEAPIPRFERAATPLPSPCHP